MSPQPHCGRKSALLTLLLFFTLLLRLAAAAPDPSPLNTTLDISALYQSADATCVGYEGQWNCLADKFQRCTAGKWTAAVSCSADEGTLDTRDTTTMTTCSPLGRTDLVEFAGECSAAWGFGGGSGWGSGSGGRCNSNGCYYGAGANLTVEKWVYALVVGVVVLGFW